MARRAGYPTEQEFAEVRARMPKAGYRAITTELTLEGATDKDRAQLLRRVKYLFKKEEAGRLLEDEEPRAEVVRLVPEPKPPKPKKAKPEPPPPPPAPPSVTSSRLRALRMIADKLTESMEDCGPGVLPVTTSQLRQTWQEIEDLETAEAERLRQVKPDLTEEELIAALIERAEVMPLDHLEQMVRVYCLRTRTRLVAAMTTVDAPFVQVSAETEG